MQQRNALCEVTEDIPPFWDHSFRSELSHGPRTRSCLALPRIAVTLKHPAISLAEHPNEHRFLYAHTSSKAPA